MIFAELDDISADLAQACAVPLMARNDEPFQISYPGVPVGQRRPLEHELYEWRKLFIGQPQILFAHCAYNVIARRTFQTNKYIPAYFRLWSEQGAFLCSALNAKWLASACDTFMDYAENETDRAIAAIGGGLLKTVKLYETEIYLGNGYLRPISPENYVPRDLFDGMHTFNIGFGDVVANYKRRLESLTANGSPASMITREVFGRLTRHYDTAYTRFLAHHTYDETKW